MNKIEWTNKAKSEVRKKRHVREVARRIWDNFPQGRLVPKGGEAA